MKILRGKQANRRKEAIDLALQATGGEDIGADIIELLSFNTDADKLTSETDKSITTAIRNSYGNKASWRGERWWVPIPALHYDAKDSPRLDINVKRVVVAAVDVRTQQGNRPITMVGAIGKPETLVIPIVFLRGVVIDDLHSFSIIARDAVYTTWNLPASKPVYLPNDFVRRLTEVLKRKSVVAWLLDFGTQGRWVAPLVAGNLLGLLFQGSEQIPLAQRRWTIEELVGALEGMAFRPGEAREMISRAAPHLKADMTLEAAIRVTLQAGDQGQIQDIRGGKT